MFALNNTSFSTLLMLSIFGCKDLSRSTSFNKSSNRFSERIARTRSAEIDVIAPDGFDANQLEYGTNMLFILRHCDEVSSPLKSEPSAGDATNLANASAASFHAGFIPERRFRLQSGHMREMGSSRKTGDWKDNPTDNASERLEAEGFTRESAVESKAIISARTKKSSILSATFSKAEFAAQVSEPKGNIALSALGASSHAPYSIASE
ncbi:unknown [Coraliomargarita sp. CAG:312]|nr:unknown [Coraliomargarita sp. CAG:312]